jgi:cardiolipin synthase
MRRDDDFIELDARSVAPQASFELLVGAEAFWRRAAADIAAARRRVWVQAMTFEGDAVGERVAAALLDAGATDRRLLIDAYSFHVVNDRLLPWLPGRDAALRAEATTTRDLLNRLVAGGVAVSVTNPVERRPLRFPLRNHKKLLVVDDVAYLGGVNFSEHNFAWHDAMVRIAEPPVAAFLAAAFEADWAGRPRCAAARIGGLELISLDGASNSAALAPVLERFRAARRSIELIGAYPTMPFTAALANAARAGCAVTIYTPARNNKPLLRDFLFAEAAAGGANFRLALLPEMTHAKAALIDGETVMFGSVNFNLASWRTNGDFLATSRDPALIAAFETDLFAPARAVARLADPGRVAAWRRARARFLLRLGDAVLARLSHRGMTRAVRWEGASG